MPTTPDLPAVRVRPFPVPRELAGKFRCSVCESPAEGDCHVVHVDAERNGRNEIKANTHLACSEACLEELHAALTVEYALVGVQNERKDTP